jgi:hypothetical protein
VWLLAAAASVWLAMMITPQGENLFLELAPTLATGLAAVVAAYAVLSHEHGRRPSADLTLGDGSALDRLGEAVVDTVAARPLPVARPGG